MYEQLKIPKTCSVDKTIFKKMFLENSDLSATDKKVFSDIIGKVIWKYSLKEDNYYLRPYVDEQREYREIEILEVQLNKQSKEKRIAELIMHAIPYPMILILRFESETQLWVSHQRNSQNDRDKNVLEDLLGTKWLQEADLADILPFEQFKRTNCYVFYSEVVDAISRFNVKAYSPKDLSGEEARLLLKKETEKEMKLAKLRAQLKKETQFNKRVEISMQIRKVEKE